MNKVKLFSLMLISMFLFTTSVYADSTSFNVTWAKDEFVYTGNEITYKSEPNVDHAQIDYIESTGTQYIDTGVSGINCSNTKAELRFKGCSVRGNLFGTYESTSYDAVGWGFYNDVLNGNYMLHYSNSNLTFLATNVAEGVITVDKNKAYYRRLDQEEKDDSLIATGIKGLNNDSCSNTLYLLSGNLGSSTSHADVPSLKVEGFKVWLNDELVREFIPVVVVKDQPKEKNSDGTNPIPAGTVCLYDKKYGIYYLNIGTGYFIPGIKLNGETYKVLESLKSSGSTYFDTGYNATINTKWIIEYKFNSHLYSHLGGGYNEDDKRFCIVNDNDIRNKVIFGIGNTSATSISTNIDKHIFVVDGPNKRGLIDGKIEANTSSSTVSNTRLYIFGRYGYDVHPAHVADLYNSKIFNNNVLVKNYIPVKRDSDGKVGIYDLENNIFYTVNNSLTAGNIDAYTGDDFLRFDKKTNAGEYITYPLSNLANALYSGPDTAFDRTWRINKVVITPSFNAYNGTFDNQEHPFSFVEAKNQNGEVVDASKYTVKYYTDDTYSTEISIDNINTEHGNFKDVQTFSFFYKVVPTDTDNYEGSQGPITIKVYKQTPSSSHRYIVPNTSVY